MKEPKVSILVIALNPDENLKLISKSLKNQDYSGKKEIIFVTEKRGLAENMNYGIKKAKNELVITLHGDCVPSSKNWLTNLIKPFKDKKVVATVSRVRMPKEVWERMSIFTKSLSIKEKGTITPAMDEKGCAYRKEVLRKAGYFEENLFKTAGEDFDMYLKLSKLGKIAYPDAIVIHKDFMTLGRRLKKTYRNAEGFGTLFRVYGRNMPGWYLGALKAIPLLGMIASVFAYPFKRDIRYYLPYFLMIPIAHIFFVYGFWKGLLTRKQRARIV